MEAKYDLFVSTYGLTYEDNFQVQAVVNEQTAKGIIAASHFGSSILKEIDWNRKDFRRRSEGRGGTNMIRITRIPDHWKGHAH